MMASAAEDDLEPLLGTRRQARELALSLLPRHVRVMLLSATIGAAHEFVNWMARSLDRRVTLVEGTDRKVPLHPDVAGFVEYAASRPGEWVFGEFTRDAHKGRAMWLISSFPAFRIPRVDALGYL